MKIELNQKEFAALVNEGAFQAAVNAELSSRDLRICSYHRLEADRRIDEARQAKRSAKTTADELASADLTYSPRYYPNGL